MSKIKKEVQVQTIVPNQITKRFVIKKNLIGKGAIIGFKSYDGIDYVYDHDVVYNQLKDRFEAMPCFAKYKSYTQTFDMPAFVKALPTLV
jgi:hypothetical protein